MSNLYWRTFSSPYMSIWFLCMTASQPVYIHISVSNYFCLSMHLSVCQFITTWPHQGSVLSPVDPLTASPPLLSYVSSTHFSLPWSNTHPCFSKVCLVPVTPKASHGTGSLLHRERTRLWDRIRLRLNRVRFNWISIQIQCSNVGWGQIKYSNWIGLCWARSW